VDANTYPLRSILNQERRYLIPTFQRDYEWTEEGQWALLLENLEAVADRLQDARHLAAQRAAPAAATPASGPRDRRVLAGPLISHDFATGTSSSCRNSRRRPKSSSERRFSTLLRAFREGSLLRGLIVLARLALNSGDYSPASVLPSRGGLRVPLV
jgi:hypothetical protein